MVPLLVETPFAYDDDANAATRAALTKNEGMVEIVGKERLKSHLRGISWFYVGNRRSLPFDACQSASHHEKITTIVDVVVWGRMGQTGPDRGLTPRASPYTWCSESSLVETLISALGNIKYVKKFPSATV
jgi:hypothetical protein